MVTEDRIKSGVLAKVLRVVIESVSGAFFLVYEFILHIYNNLIRNSKIFLVIFAIVGSITGTLYLARTKPELLGIARNQQEVALNEEVGKLIEEVGKIIALPQGETPTVATVTDLEKVKNQAFFANAQNGDKVLIFANAKKAILYRPSEKKIIEVGVVNVQKQPEKEEVSPTPMSTSSPAPSPLPSPTLTPTPSESE